jgi:hypothetical protein
MKKISREYTFEATVSLSLDTSYGNIKRENNVLLDCTLGLHNDSSGHYEIYDIETGGESWYAEGTIDFDGMDVVGYDGAFSLPQPIEKKLLELGYSLDKL